MVKRLIFCVVLVSAAGLFAQTKKKTPVPVVVTTARSVAIVPLNANSRADWFSDSGVTAEDRRMCDSVLNALHAWGKYRYTIDTSTADIVIAVRAGRGSEVWSGPSIVAGGLGRPTGRAVIRPSLSLDGGTNLGPKDDTMAVFVTGNPNAPPLWIHSKSEGLQGKLPLFEQFRKDVEKSEQILAEKKP